MLLTLNLVVGVLVFETSAAGLRAPPDLQLVGRTPASDRRSCPTSLRAACALPC
jgi:hypothetical protein